jgi:ABC-type branched-subunit amino acid transport system ATPase component
MGPRIIPGICLWAEVLLEELRAFDLTILLIEQNMEFALAVADCYAVLAGGEIVHSGLASEPGIDARVVDGEFGGVLVAPASNAH